MSAARSSTGATLVILLASHGVLATVPLDGELKAERDCPAVSSIKRGTNLGEQRLTPGATYRLLGKNKADATHFQVLLVGAQPSERWVEVGCGSLVTADSPNSVAPPDQAPISTPVPTIAAYPKKGPAGVFVLAASWQQAFCQIRPRKSECRDEGARSDRINRFSLHGLWPQPRDRVYCNVSNHERGFSERGPWRSLPPLDLEYATRVRLKQDMPGTVSYLHRHEWTKHGTCYGTDEEAYYRHALSLLDQLNSSLVRELFAGHVGDHLSSTRIRETFNHAFGRGAGERVRVNCEDGMITELQIELAGRIGADTSLGELMLAAKRRYIGCRGGRVDAAGVGNLDSGRKP